MAIWVNEHFGLAGDQDFSKIKVHKVAHRVIEQYETHGPLTAISDQEMEEKVRDLMPAQWEKYRGEVGIAG